MADFAPALEFLLNSEDRNRQYAVVSDSCPKGCAGPCYAVSGINSGAWPSLFAAIAALPQSQRAAAVASFYKEQYWDPMGLSGLLSQDVANRVLDQAVNGGKGSAVLILQTALRILGLSVALDGAMGPATMAAANQADPEAILDAYRQQRLHRYIAIAAAHPADAPYLKGWEARALA